MMDARVARISSHWFLVLAVYLYYCDYSTLVVLGQLGQYALTWLVWSPPVTAGFIWADRCMAVANMAILSTAHHQRTGASYMYMLGLLAVALCFKLLVCACVCLVA